MAKKIYVGSDIVGTTDAGDIVSGTLNRNRLPASAPERVFSANVTLSLADREHVVAIDSGSNLTVTVPTNASVEFPLGTVVNVYRAGSGSVSIVGQSGVTIRNAGSIPDQFGEVSLRKRATDEWVLVGEVDEP